MRLRLSLVLLAALVIMTACEKAEETPTPTPNQESIQAASTMFAQPTRSTLPTPTVTPVNEVEIELSRVVARMEHAVLAGDYDTYMTYVWDGDPVFRYDHAQWARDWTAHPLDSFDIELYGIRSISDDTAETRMTVLWRLAEYEGESLAGGATITAVFHREGDEWLMGGESWQIASTEGIQFYYFANDVLNNQPQADTVIGYLPSIYARVTKEFDFVPDTVAHIRMYESPITLHNWTRISRPLITTWNEPGESIKLALGPSNTPPHESEVAREYTRFVLFEMGGGARGDYPWWFEAGISEYGAGIFRTFSQRNRTVKRIAGLSLASENDDFQLLDWQSLDEEPVPFTEIHEIAVNQSFTLVHYITEAYGAGTRNAWITAIANGQTIDNACQEHLGVSFEELDAQWRVWLPEQL
ncbi:MAG: hypothetical protein JXQ72_08440 [Anaerolineae bacterium]|nr:hypothetical protein [Anaerolineae bacterium]